MKTLFDAIQRGKFVQRLEQLAPNSQPSWGEMTVAQMLRHLRFWEEMIHENKIYKRTLIGRLIGPLILKQVLKTPNFRRNSPTISEMLRLPANKHYLHWKHFCVCCKSY